MTLEPGQILDGKYRIVRLLGSGGMGSVYEGENARIHRKVAIKVLHAGVAAKQDVVQRFEREAQAAGRIGSEHIVEVLDLGSLPGGERYMVMEFLDGTSLGDRIKARKRLEPREVAPIVHQMLEGLAAAHEAGIIHRDLKPDNVYLLTSKGGQKDFVKVLDFGVSKFSALEQDSMSMTRTGAVMGTPYYMSPEQARGAKIDPRSDLYSVGVVLYQAVTGRVPFNAETFNELVFKIALESPHPAELVTPGLDPAFASIIAKAMMRDASGRFQNAREFQQALGHWIQSGQGVASAPNAAFMAHAAAGLPGGQPHVGNGGTQALPVMQPAFGQSQPGFGQSQPGFAPHQSQPGMQSSPQFGPGQSSPQLGASQAGLAMTAPQPRNSGAMIAIGLIGTLVLAGGAFGAYKYMGARAAAAEAAATAPPSTEPAPTIPAPPAPSAEPTAAASADPAPSAAPSTTPAATASPTAPKTAAVAPPVAPPRPPGPAPGPGAKKPPAPTATPPSKGGRTVSGDL